MTHDLASRRIVARGQIAASPDAVFGFLSDLGNHARLAPGAVEVRSLERQPDGGARALVRLKGPLGIRRSAVTELLPADPASDAIIGRARIGRRTAASVVWTIRPNGNGSAVTIRAEIESVNRLDGFLLRAGADRWVARRFAVALARLTHELRAAPARRPDVAHLMGGGAPSTLAGSAGSQLHT